MSDSASDTPEMLDVLRSGPVGVSSPDEVARARTDMLPWLEEEVVRLPARRAEHRTRRRRLWGTVGGLSVAAATLLAFVGTRVGDDEEAADASGTTTSTESNAAGDFATLVSGKVKSGTMEVLAGSRIGGSSRVSTGPDHHASLRSSAGVDIELRADSDLSLASPDEDSKLTLHGGEARFSVPPLPRGRTFVVSTSDAEVTVVGTEFSVRQAEGRPTCVRVTEGKVLVVRETGRELIGAGQASGCDVETGSAESGSAEEKGAQIRAPKDGIAHSKTPSTTLADENALLTRALSAERQENLPAAERAFRALLRKYPNSAFAQDARDGIRRIEGVKPSE